MFRAAPGIVATAVLAAGIAGEIDTAPAASGVAHSEAARPAVIARHYATVVDLCGAATRGQARCFAERRIVATAHTPNATAYSIPPGVPLGPAGGYTPKDIATAYHVPRTSPGHPLVAVVAAYNDPTARRDLDTFDHQYHLAPETHRSLQVLSQAGTPTNLPPREPGWAGEQGVDLQAIRGLCHRCRIRLVEAASQDLNDLAQTEDTAAALQPLVINDSFGFAESTVNHRFTTAFNHPGIAIVAANGDAGMDDWDLSNAGFFPAPSVPEAPASLPTVVAVGGTSLQLRRGGRYRSESVWDGDGPDDTDGAATDRSLGATGGGCSKRYAAPGWQPAVAGWSRTGCHGRRLAADLAADADPVTGYDVFESYGQLTPGWFTAGGTSLAAPFVAAMYALAGGAHGTPYPAVSLYGHLASTPRALHDVVAGGNGYCGGDSPRHCFAQAGGNPNRISAAYVDCAFALRGSHPRRTTAACNARRGYDGPSGVGTPRGLAEFRPLRLSVRITARRVGIATYRFSATVVDPTPGGHHLLIDRWSWGDGTAAATARTPTHRYRSAGSHLVRLTITDRFGEIGRATLHVNG
jgi:hypothetical protein